MKANPTPETSDNVEVSELFEALGTSRWLAVSLNKQICPE
jgi:sulfur carrier protein ThiS